MHKRRVNELKIRLVIEPAGPILIKSGDESGADPTLPAMNFVRTQHPRKNRRTIYLPGASLKGVIRSHSERILHTVFGENTGLCCNPLDRNSNCASRIRKARIADTARQYQALCLACRIFGHEVHGSHFFTADAYPDQPIDELPVRNNVAIDRLSGGVAVGPFDMEVALAGKFGTTLQLTNFELWQVGLLALALRDLAEGRVRIGFAKSRGLGEVKVYLAQLEVGYPGHFTISDYRFKQQLYGVGALAAGLRADYDFVDGEDVVAFSSEKGVFNNESTAWGRPSILFGATTDQPEALKTAVLQEAHQQVTAVLAQTMTAWSNFVQARRGRG